MANNKLLGVYENKCFGEITPDGIGALSKGGGVITGGLTVTDFFTAKRLSQSDYTAPIEIGPYIDFHHTDSSADYDGRLEINSLGELTFNHKLVFTEENIWRSGRAQIQSGTYTGTGTYGQSNPNVLTFGFEPKIVMIFEQISVNITKEADASFPVILMKDQITRFVVYNTTYSNVTWSGNTVQWYEATGNGMSAYGQLNQSGNVYGYIAIG